MGNQPSGKVRIIAGKWRSRKITFPAIPGLRPTHDRIRETLFNWLMNDVVGSTCLDLFAGSGVLGFEALSRGAKHVTFVDNSPEVIASLKNNVATLNAELFAEIIQAECPDSLLKLKRAPFDIVFLDPPFFQNLIPAAIDWLEGSNYLKAGALIYVEMEDSLSPLPVPVDWEISRWKKTSTLIYSLFKRQLG